jgi:hypothetical protein
MSRGQRFRGTLANADQRRMGAQMKDQSTPTGQQTISRERLLARAMSLALCLAGAASWPAGAADEPVAVEAEAAVEAPAAPEAVQAHEAMQAADQAPAPKAVTRPRRTVSPLDRRIALLAKELDLDAAQQARVRALLEAQRQQVARVWNDTSIPAANRVGATQGIGDHTADQIRSLLTEEQRKKYIQPRRREAAVGTAGSNVESWMNSDKLTAKP